MTPRNADRWRRCTAPALALGLLLFIGNFLYVTDFGIYEDDYVLTNPGFLWTWAQAWKWIRFDLLAWPQGRPVGFALTHLVSYLSGRFSSLLPGFGLGFAIQWANALLLFKLAARFVRAPAALVAAAVFTLYPADNSKPILQMRVFNGLNLTFLLLALHLYLHRRWLLAYACATLSLLTYECFFFPFAIAPLLVPSIRTIRPRRVLVHGAACAAIPAALLFVRRQMGEERAVALSRSPGQLLARVASASAIGSWTSLSSLGQRAWEGLSHASGTSALAALVVAASMLLLTGRLASSAEVPARASAASVWVLAIAGALGLALGYVTAFRPANYPPVVTVGRLSGFNAAGATGCCLLVAAVLSFGLERLGARGRWAWAMLTALLVAGLVSFGIEVQRRDYVENWRQQRELWAAVLATSGEWDASTPIVIDIEKGDTSLWSTRGFSQWWIAYNALYALRQFVDLPSSWVEGQGGTYPPAVFAFARYLGAEAVTGGVRLHLPEERGAPSDYPILRDGQFILFQFSGRRLQRVSDPFDTGAGVVRPKPPPSPPPPMRRVTRLYRALIYVPPEWPSLATAHNRPSQ